METSTQKMRRMIKERDNTITELIMHRNQLQNKVHALEAENAKLREAAQAYLKAERLVDEYEYDNDGMDDYLLRTKLYRVRNDRLDALAAALEVSDGS